MTDTPKPGSGNRSQRRGHWTRGKRRHKQATALCRRIAAVIEAHRRRGVISLEAVARHVGVSKRTVHRWLRGEDYPAEVYHPVLADWLKTVQAELAAERRRALKGERA